MYKVLVSREAERKAEKIDRRYKKAINEAVTKLSTNPFLGKSLTGEFKGQYSLRVGIYRILYTFDSKNKLIYLITIDHRKDIYR